MFADGLVNPRRLPGEIRVHSANDDAGVLRIFPVQANEMAAIQRKHRTGFLGCKLQHFRVRHGLVGLAGFLNGQHVVAERAEFLNGGKRKVFVGIKPRHHPASFSSIWRLISLRCERT